MGKTGPRAKGGTKNMNGVTDVSAEGGLTGMVATKEMVTVRVKNSVATRTREGRELRWEAR